MFIQTEPTPNPATLKFLPGRSVLPHGTLEMRDKAAANQSPLAERLFEVEGVSGVFFGSDFISVTKAGAANGTSSSPRSWAPSWSISCPARRCCAPRTRPRPAKRRATSSSPRRTPRRSAIIKDLIETRVRPAVANDGGDITFRGFKDGIVYLDMKGACSGCPSSTATLRHGIQNLLRHYVPDVVEVRPMEA